MSEANRKVHWDEPEAFVGCRSFPKIDAVQQAIEITREAFEHFQRLKPARGRRDEIAELHDKAVLHVIWHQQFAIAARSSRRIYIPNWLVSDSGLFALSDKDNHDGYKCRLVWFPQTLRDQMRFLESFAHLKIRCPVPRGRPQLKLDEMPGFKNDSVSSKDSFEHISRERIRRVSAPFFDFPVNTPRRVMRYMLWDRGLSSEYLDVFMGHWRERQEPWARCSSLDYGDYLRSITEFVPAILEELGFGPGRKERRA